ncbi:MAG: TlpA family protein disulfide reductase, partial [Clostridia bacterium]|nr:TlpA family protein disulfide reductase [Clostridia bacterium]
RLDETPEPAVETEPAPTGTPEQAPTEPPKQESKPAEVAGPVMKNMAPDFKAYDDAGNPVSLRDMRGKPVVVNFFASWCGPCKMEMPYFEECYLKYGEDVTFMMVNLCAFGNDTKENGKAMVEAGGWTFPVYFDSDGDAAMKYAIRSMPTTIFVSAQGELKGRHTGVMDMATLEKTIQGMIADHQQ